MENLFIVPRTVKISPRKDFVKWLLDHISIDRYTVGRHIIINATYDEFYSPVRKTIRAEDSGLDYEIVISFDITGRIVNDRCFVESVENTDCLFWHNGVSPVKVKDEWKLLKAIQAAILKLYPNDIAI